ncbi:MAG: hypothetical protein M3P32_08005 [Chloroflexota bacterium]|nr:hypothetical protein [Chloroflexota bacterium]
MSDERDTSADAGAVQRATFRRLTPSERAALGVQMSEEARALAADGLRHRRPDATEAEIQSALRRLMLGDALADRADRSR